MLLIFCVSIIIYWSYSKNQKNSAILRGSLNYILYSPSANPELSTLVAKLKNKFDRYELKSKVINYEQCTEKLLSKDAKNDIRITTIALLNFLGDLKESPMLFL